MEKIERFKANDGRIFDDEEKCLRHEKNYHKKMENFSRALVSTVSEHLETFQDIKVSISKSKAAYGNDLLEEYIMVDIDNTQVVLYDIGSKMHDDTFIDKYHWRGE